MALLFRGKKRNKDYIYCWYQRDGVREKASQHTRNHRSKLYVDGKLFETIKDRLEKNDLATQKDHEVISSDYPILKAGLDKHIAATKTADPIQTENRNRIKRGSKEKTKKKKPKKKKVQ